MESLRGQLLIAEPTLMDPNFRRTVILVAEHSEEGALGLVLNRPTEVRLADAAPDLAPLAEHDAVLHIGGPVAPEGAILLAEFDDPAVVAVPIVGMVGLVAAGTDLERLPAAVRRARAFVGHSGWGPGQLDAEVEAEGWIVEAPAPDELFCDRPEGLWSTVLTRKGGRYALGARMPLDPSMN